MKLEDISLAELSEVLAPGGSVDNDTGLWTTWKGEEPAFGFPIFPFVCLYRVEPWCEIRFYHGPPAFTWLTVAVDAERLISGEFPDKSRVHDAVLACHSLMQHSIDGVEAVFPSIIFDEQTPARKPSLFGRLFRHKRVVIGLE